MAERMGLSHGDKVTKLLPGFKAIAETKASPFAGIADETRVFYGSNSIPEVTHTTQGRAILQRFVHVTLWLRCALDVGEHVQSA